MVPSIIAISVTSTPLPRSAHKRVRCAGTSRLKSPPPPLDDRGGIVTDDTFNHHVEVGERRPRCVRGVRSRETRTATAKRPIVPGLGANHHFRRIEQGPKAEAPDRYIHNISRVTLWYIGAYDPGRHPEHRSGPCRALCFHAGGFLPRRA